MDNHQSTEFMDALLAAYQDENAEYKITRNHIKALLAVNCYPIIGYNISLRIQTISTIILNNNLQFLGAFLWSR